MGLVIPAKNGHSEWTRRRHVELGIWRPLFPGIYWEGAAPPRVPDFARAALQWAGPGALLAGTTAAHLHGLEEHWSPFPLTVLVPPHRRPRGGDGVEVIRAELEARDVTRVHGWPCTAPARTLIDCAAHATADQLAVALECAWRRDRHLPSEVAWRLARGLRGGATLREVVFDALRRGRPLRSVLEVRLWRLLLACGLPLPRTDVRVHDDDGVMYLDFAYPLRGLVIETDGRAYHGPDRFEPDRLRDQRLAALGWIVFKVTWKQLRDHPAAVMKRLKEMLARCPVLRRRPVILEQWVTPLMP